MARILEQGQTILVKLVNCSIVIRAYNEERHIGRLLEGIRQQTIKDVEIILVDSGSTDGTVAIAESFGARIVHIPSAEFTFGRSLNLGIQAATREWVVIASAHVYPVYPDWLESLLRPFEDEMDRVDLRQTARTGNSEVFGAANLSPVVSRYQQAAPGNCLLQQCQRRHPKELVGKESL